MLRGNAIAGALALICCALGSGTADGATPTLDFGRR